MHATMYADYNRVLFIYFTMLIFQFFGHLFEIKTTLTCVWIQHVKKVRQKAT